MMLFGFVFSPGVKLQVARIELLHFIPLLVTCAIRPVINPVLVRMSLIVTVACIFPSFSFLLLEVLVLY